ncbi:hypothetical protein GCM10028817_27020 [Spirosoma pomorum]
MWLVCCVATCQASAQAVFSGRVTDATHAPLPGISVTLHPPTGTAIVAFGITDPDGRFSIPAKSSQDSLRIRVVGLGWAVQEKRLPNRTQTLSFSLVAQPIALKEVRVKVPPVTKQSDTLSYAVDAFKSKTDRVIADVIRKLPGIEMEADGRILYQGKPINKYYIEGMDLLDNKYRLANDNLPIESVVKVQVIENHQPIRMLDSLVFSDRAALNISLKNNVTVTGTAQVGGGAAPLLWDANVTPMLFTRRNQFIGSYQTNNTGNNVAQQLRSFSPGTVLNPKQNDDQKKDWVSLQPLATPLFDETRWLNNNTHLGTLNHLKKMANDVDLRWNVAYLNDYQQQRGYTNTTYFTPEDTIRIREDQYNRLFFHSLEARLTIQKNSPKKYLKNELSAKGNWDQQQGAVTLNDVLGSQRVSNPFFWISNQFEDILHVGKQLITLRSATRISRTPQSLIVKPSQLTNLLDEDIPNAQIRQQVLATSFETDNSLSLTRQWRQFTLLPQLGVTVEQQTLNSTIQIDDTSTSRLLANNFSNNLNWFSLNGYLRLKTQYRRNAWRLELDSPLNYYRFLLSDPLANKGQRLERLVLEPRLTAHNNLTQFWEIHSTFQYRNRFGEIDDVHYGYLLRTYRTLQRRDVPLQNRQTVLGSVGLNYRNPITSLFGSLSYQYSLSQLNLLYRSRINEQGAVDYSAINQINYASVQSVDGQLGKYLPELKTNISARLNWLTTTNAQIINGSLVNLTNQSLSPGLSVATNAGKWADLSYTYQLSLYKVNLSESSTQTTTQQKHQLKLNAYPAKHSSLSIENEYYVNQLSTSTNRNFFTNILFRWALPGKKIDLETSWLNVWNTSTLTTVSITSFSYIESAYVLRPTQIVQKVRFSF